MTEEARGGPDGAEAAPQTLSKLLKMLSEGPSTGRPAPRQPGLVEGIDAVVFFDDQGRCFARQVQPTPRLALDDFPTA